MTASLIRLGLGTALLILGIATVPFMLKAKPLQIVLFANSVTSLAWSPDGGTLGIGSSDNTVNLWDAQNHKFRRAIQLSSNIVSLAWSPESAMIASGTWTDHEEPTVVLWDADTAEAVRTISVPTQRLRALSWSPDGKVISIGLEENTVLFWNIETARMAGPHPRCGKFPSIPFDWMSKKKAISNKSFLNCRSHLRS